MKDARFAEACAKLEESHRLDPSSGTLLWLGDCYEKINRPASAWKTFMEAIPLAEKQGKPEKKEIATQRADSLLSRVSYIIINVEHPAPQQETTLDGKRIEQLRWGQPNPVDPGPHTVGAKAPGRVELTRQITISEDGARQSVELPELEKMAPPRTAKPAATASAPGSSAPVPASQPPSSNSALPSYVVGAGALLLAGGAILQVNARSLATQANEQRDGETYSKASSRQTIAFIGVGLGSVTLAGGIAWMLLSGNQPSNIAVLPGVGPGFAGLVVNRGW
jgi:hypothetical protein